MSYDEVFSRLIGKLLMCKIRLLLYLTFQRSEEFLRENNNDMKCHSIAIVIYISL